MSSLRMIGPTIGYALARVFLSVYVNLTEQTTLKPSDPAWIGAWWLGKSLTRDAPFRVFHPFHCFHWLGYLVIGIVQLGTGWSIALFPRRLPTKSSVIRRQAVRVRRTLKEFPAALKRLLTNKILVFNNLASAFYVFGIGGYLTFMPKYLETQFQQSAAQAGFLNGSNDFLTNVIELTP